MVNIVPSQTTFPPVLPLPANDPTNAGNLTSGTISPSRLPLPTTGSPGAVFAATAPANQLQIGIATTGAPIFAQPAFANLIGTIAGSQMVAPTLNSLGGVVSASAPANQVQTGINTAGAPTFAQPSFGNLSGQLLAAQSPAYTGDVSTASGSLTTAIGANVVTNAQLAQTPSLTVKSNIAGGTANPADNTLAAVIDAAMGNTRGAILERGSSGWTALAPGAAGNVLTTNGAGADPSWQAGGGAGAFPNVFTVANLKITNGGTPNSQVAVTADRASLVGASAGILTTAVNLTIGTGSTGANGLDTGTVAASTWYAVYIISNGTTTAGLLSTSATAPTMPGGYTFKARVGWVRTDGSSNLLRILQLGRTARYQIVSGSNVPNIPIAATTTSTAVGNVTTPTWIAISLTNYVPSTAATLIGLGGNTSSSYLIVAPSAAYGSATSTTNPPPYTITPSASAFNFNVPFVMGLESTSIYWAAGATGTLFIGIIGWEDNL